MTVPDARLADVNTAYRRLRHAAAAAEALREPYLRAIRARFDAWLERQAAERGMALDGAFGQLLFGWDHPVWGRYAPPPPGVAAPMALRLGRVAGVEAPGLAEVPALLPIVGRGHVFVRSSNPARGRRVLESSALRLLLTAPPGMVRLALFDPVTAGAALAAFLRLPPLLRGDGIAVRSEDMDRLLQAIEQHVAEVNQQRLTNLYPDIEAYNAGAGVVPVPYRFLLFADLPAGLEARGFEHLAAIARNGPRAGVYILASVDPGRTPSRDADLDGLLALGTVLDVGPDVTTRLVLPGAAAPMPVVVDAPPGPARANPWLEAYGAAAQDAASRLVFSRFAIAESERWRGDSTDGLAVTVGVTGAGEPWPLEIGRGGSTVHHGLIVGMPGSGKSNLLHVLITQLALRYAPEELELYLLDFREGVGFQPYAALPQVRALALESEREFALSILLHLQAAMTERGQRYKQLPGGAVEQFPDYRRQSGQALPRKLLVMDEFQVLFREDDRLAHDAERVLADLAKRGRGFGIHLLLCSQSLNLATRSGSQVYDMMDLRIALRCAAADSAKAIGSEAAAKLEQPGDALLNLAPGVHRVASLPVEERRRFVAEAAALAVGRAYPPAVTFESQAPADWRRNPALAALRSAPAWPAGDGDGGPAVLSPAMLWLGEPVAMSPPVAAVLERYARMNLLVAGGSEAEAYGLLAAAVVSVAAQRAPESAAFAIADFARPGSPGHGALARLASRLPHTARCLGPRESADLPAELAATLAERADGAAGPEIYVVVAGLHRWRELRSPDPYSPSEASQILARVAEEGPELGIQLIAWADGSATLDRALKRGAAAQFDHRAVLRVGEKDSQDLLGTNVAAKLEDNRAIYRNEDDELGKMTKFKPYALLAADDEAAGLAGLKERGW